MLQNADDAGSTKFKILKKNNYLFVANNGRKFNHRDLESLCRSASSSKVRGQSIGYRGIGFKSVIGFAKEIHIISGDLEITFSKNKTANEIPQATQVPLIRIPHKLCKEDKEEFDSVVDHFKKNDYVTIFVFSGVTAHEIELEFDSFDTSSLFFLNNICETDLNIGKSNKTVIEKIKLDNNTTRVKMINELKTVSWLIAKNQETSIAFYEEEQKIKKLDELNSLVYAFLPTEDSSGLGVLINGDFSTDPSRKHLIFDSKTLATLKSCGKHILDILNENIHRGDDINLGMINSLIPFVDPRMLQFKKPSFEKFLMEELKFIGYHIFKDSLICPNWFNFKDYSRLSDKNSVKQINSKCFDLDVFLSFVKYLGVKEDNLYSFKQNINDTPITMLGCVQIAVQIFKDIISKINHYDESISQLKVLMVSNERKSLDQIKAEKAIIDQPFISSLVENGLTEFDIKQVLNKFLPADNIEVLFNDSSKRNELYQKNTEQKTENRWFNKTHTISFPAAKANVQRWRSAEENTIIVLNSNGFNLTDVSKQNIGYDIEGIDPDGNEIQIEVKSITMIGQKFKLTNNEISVAQEKREAYFIAIVRQLDDFIEIALISDPVKNLVFNRQCVQWIWECSNYNYNPTRFEI